MVKGEQFEVPVPEDVNLGTYFLDVNLELGRGDQAALHHADGTCSFRELWLLTNRVGNVFRELGAARGDRVLLVLEDSPEWVAAWLAAMKIGAVGTHAYTYLTPQDYAYLLGLVRPAIVVADPTTLRALREAARTARFGGAILVTGEAAGERAGRVFSLPECLASAPEPLDAEPTRSSDAAFWNFSGGTTGRAKGVAHTHRDGVIAHASFDRVFRYTTEDVVLRVPKLFFHYARDLGMLYPLRSGASVVLFREWASAPLMFRLMAKYRPSVLLNVPTMMRAMIQTPAPERRGAAGLRCCMSSGEQLSAQLYREWIDGFGGEVMNRFGSAESGMGYLCNGAGAAAPGSAGTVTPLAEVKLVDDAGGEVGPGRAGVLLARCPAAGGCYVNEPEKSRATFLPGGWIDTGDVFAQDERDCFWYVGRANEMVKVSGVWVSPFEIERVLGEHPGVRECAVLGIEDGDGLMKIKAFVVLREATRRPERVREELKRFCKARLAPNKFPRSIEFVDELPKTRPGKIDRRSLRERARTKAAASL